MLQQIILVIQPTNTLMMIASQFTLNLYHGERSLIYYLYVYTLIYIHISHSVTLYLLQIGALTFPLPNFLICKNILITKNYPIRTVFLLVD